MMAGILQYKFLYPPWPTSPVHFHVHLFLSPLLGHMSPQPNLFNFLIEPYYQTSTFPPSYTYSAHHTQTVHPSFLHPIPPPHTIYIWPPMHHSTPVHHQPTLEAQQLPIPHLLPGMATSHFHPLTPVHHIPQEGLKSTSPPRGNTSIKYTPIKLSHSPPGFLLRLLKVPLAMADPIGFLYWLFFRQRNLSNCIVPWPVSLESVAFECYISLC